MCGIVVVVCLSRFVIDYTGSVAVVVVYDCVVVCSLVVVHGHGVVVAIVGWLTAVRVVVLMPLLCCCVMCCVCCLICCC